MADVACHGCRARLAARALAGLARDGGVDLDVAVHAEDDVAEFEGDLHEGVLPAFPTRARTPRAGSAAAEEGLEDVSEAAEPGTAESAAVAANVVAGPLIGVAQHVVRVGDELEALGRVVSRIHIRVQLAGQAPVRLLDLIRTGVARDAEDLVVVSHGGLSARGERGVG